MPSKTQVKKQTAKTKPNAEFIMPEKPYKKIAITFIFLTAILVLIIVYFSLSKAVITVIPAQVAEPQEFLAKIPLATSSAPQLLTALTKTQELELVRSFEVKEFELREGKASGPVTIYNNKNTSQTLVATTRFLTEDGLLFRLKKQVTIPAKSEITAEIEADESGDKYDISPTRFSIPGLSEALQKLVWAESKEKMSGGVKRVGTLTATEIATAQEKMLNGLDELIKKELKIDNNFDKIILFNKEITSQDISNKEGDEVEKFQITVKLKVETVEINKEKLLTWTKEQYKKELGLESEILNYDLDSFTAFLESITSLYANVKTSLTAYVLGDLDIEKFEKKKIFGMDEEALEYFFKQYDNIKEVKVDFWPFWVRTVPSMPDHVVVEIE